METDLGGESKPSFVRPMAAALVVTGLTVLCSRVLPDTAASTAVGFVFLGATWWLVWRHTDAVSESHGLGLGGLMARRELNLAGLARASFRAVAFALAAALVTFVPFILGWQRVFSPKFPFAFGAALALVLSDSLGQLLVVALPEEAFFRGYLQTALARAFSRGFSSSSTLLAIATTSAIFALGHLATVPGQPGRLAVFFPSLVFGLLRHRSIGIGAPIVYHAMCNLLSAGLFRGYGLG